MHRATPPSRTQGRANPEREKRKNRKPNRKTLADQHEDERDIKDAKHVDSSNGIPISTRNNSTVDIPTDVGTNHSKVEANRPKVPSWFQRQEGMQPSRSYSAKKTEDEEK